MKKISKLIAALAAGIMISALSSVAVFAGNVVVTYVLPDRIVPMVVPQGTNMTYMGPTDVNYKGYAFCGWSVPLANVQTDVIAYAVYLPTGTESQSVDVCNVYHHLPTGVLSYTTATPVTIPETTRNLKTPMTVMPVPGVTLTAEQTIRLNPVGDPFRTCVVKWYNGSTGELWKADVVAYGGSLPTPATPCIDGLEFVGWDGSWTNITYDHDIIACYYKAKHIHYKCGKCGDLFDEKWIRSTDSYSASTESISLSSHNHSPNYHWEFKEEADGVNVTATVIFE
ncbi:MAG: hypothetical protein J5829_07265 [Lachnospiraceae bacterium]|nr:hypothetical protein [Lachnospiraceae bacterium]